MSEKNRFIAFDKCRLNKAKIKKDDEDELVVETILTREIVQKYADGFAYKPADELEKTAWTADGRWVKMLSHPAGGTIQKVNDISGKVDNVHSVKNLMDYKTGRPNRKGIVGDVHFFKHSRGREGVTPVPQDILEQVKAGDLVDVSIGFLYEKDLTKGVWKEGGDISYDYIQRNIMIDHLAAPLIEGRCPSPYCGLGQDSAFQGPRFIGLDPWEETEENIRSGHGSSDDFDKGSLRTIDITEGVKAIVGCPKGNYEDGKCKVGMEVQSYLFSKTKFDEASAKAWFSEHEKKGKDILGSDGLNLEQIQDKIDALYSRRDKLQEESNAQMRPKDVDPEVSKKWREIEGLDAEIRAFKELKAKKIVENGDDNREEEKNMDDVSKLSEGEMLSKLLDGYAEKDKLVADAMSLYATVGNVANPMSKDLMTKLEALDLHLKIYREAYGRKATGIQDGKDAKCPICDQIRKLGGQKTSEILVGSFGLDAVMLAFESGGKEKPLDSENEMKRSKALIESIQT